jgi:hypothetical protein
MLAPLYNPTAFSHILTIITGATEIENRALFLSKSFSLIKV